MILENLRFLWKDGREVKLEDKFKNIIAGLSRHFVQEINKHSDENLEQGSPTWYPRVLGRPQGPSRSPAGLL